MEQAATPEQATERKHNGFQKGKKAQGWRESTVLHAGLYIIHQGTFKEKKK